MKEKNKDKTISLAVTKDLIVRVIPEDNHEFLMTTNQAAYGYAVSFSAIKSAKSRHSKELIEGVHFIKGVANCDTLEATKRGGAFQPHNAQPHQIFWTKAGIVRLGFFIRSERAKLFRDWAERLILKIDEQRDLFGNIAPYAPQKAVKSTPFNPLTKKNIMSIITDVCEIEDKELRMRIINKLVGEGVVK